jgi:hypothetical protein
VRPFAAAPVVVLVVAFAVGGCRDESAPSPPAPAASIDEEVITVDDTIPGESPEIDAGPPDEGDQDDEEDPNDACAPVDPKLKPMQLLQFRWTSGLKGKQPKDKLYVARPGQRVYAHLKIRNRSGRKRCLKFVFRVGKKKRTEVTVRIGKSWNWRTWAYNTIKSSDRAPLHLTITDDQGKTIVDQRLAVIPERK